jgi:hypothetical protein
MARNSRFATEALSRRRAVAAIGTGLAVGLAGCSGGGDSTTAPPDTDTEAPADTDTPASSPTATPEPAPEDYQAQLDLIESATADLSSPAAAMGAGFLPAGPTIPGIGFQFANQSRIEAAAMEGFTLSEPQLLGFVQSGGSMSLAWVGYTGPAAALSDNPDILNEEDADTDDAETWSTSEAATRVLAIPDGEVTDTQFTAPENLIANDNWSMFSPPSQDMAVGDTVSLNWGSPRGKTGERTERIADSVTNSPSLHSLRVWVHAENPAGTLQPQNPELLPPSMRPGGGGTPTDGGSNSTAGDSNSTS